VLLIGAFIAMLYYLNDVVDFVTPYMNSWPAIFRDGARLLSSIGIGIGWVILSYLGYIELTLIVGQPFYEAISKRVEADLGAVAGEVNVSFFKTLPRTLFEWIRLTIRSIMVAIFLFAIEFVPVVGTVGGIVLGAIFMGWVLALEVTSVPFDRRGLHYGHRKKALRQHRRLTLGFGAATFLCFLIPLGAIVFMPAAVAGATLLSRRVLTPATLSPAAT
jgi:CysZ protein